MDAANDIPDSTDWLNTPLSALASVENALHCQICKEFFDTPMITSCSHTFCSRCIRIALSTDGSCPACRSPDQASKLRNNWSLQEVLSTFVDARPAVLQVARREQDTEAQGRRPEKRKRTIQATDNGDEDSQGRTTRSKSRRLVNTQSSQPESIVIDSGEDDEEVDSHVPEVQYLDDGLVECPLGCRQRMKIEQVEPHLDKCEDERKAREQAAVLVKKPPAAPRPQDRLNQLNYSLLKERDLARKMRELGIPATGTKQMLVRRHTAWVNIWNANCDSSRPRTKRELLRELDVWDRTQGSSSPSVTSSIMTKDFDGSGWSKRNQDDFSRLIESARKTRIKAAQQKQEKDDAGPKSDDIEAGTQVALWQSPTPIENVSVADESSRSHDTATMNARISTDLHEEPLQSEALIAQTQSGSYNTVSVPEGDSVASRWTEGRDNSIASRPTEGPDMTNAWISHLETSPEQQPAFGVQAQPLQILDGIEGSVSQSATPDTGAATQTMPVV